MTIQELIDALKLLKGGDQESSHIDADWLLLKYINNMDVTRAFDEIDKWYS